MSFLINKQEVSTKCRILGVHVLASPSELKNARDRLAKLYHPDKHMNEPPEVREQIQERFKIIQGAYEYLKDNHKEIQKEFAHMDDFILTSKENSLSRAHWVYKAVETYT
jgi:DnaJ-class molecular chaperone